MTEHSSALSCHILKDVNGFLHISSCFFQDFAHFLGFEFCQLFFVFFEKVGGFKKDLSASRGRNVAP